MTIIEDDLDRVQRNYVDDENLTLDDLREDLDEAGFDGNSLDAFTDGIGGVEDLAVSDNALNEAQRQAAGSVGPGGAVNNQLVRGEGGKTIGAPENVEQRIERTGKTTGEVIGTNRNTGTEGVIGEVELAPPPDLE
jgi:hypothetical protein